MAVCVVWVYVVGLVGSVLVLERRDFTLFIVIMSYVVPVTIMCVSYVIIGYVAIQHARQLNKWDSTGLRLHPNNSKTSGASTKSRGTGGHSYVSRELKAALRILLILAMFVGAWTPFMSLNIRHYVCASCSLDPSLLKYFKMLHYANSSLNPVLFIMLNPRWRTAFLMAICQPNVNSQDSSFTITNTLGWS